MEHDILEVTSGYRVALTYSLCCQGKGNRTSRLTSNEDVTGKMLRIFRRFNERPSRIGILLEHKYTSQSLETNGMRALKGRDNEWFNLLMGLNDRLDKDDRLCFHIASAELKVEYCLVAEA